MKHVDILIWYARILFPLLKFTGHLSDRLKVFAGLNEKFVGFVWQSCTFREDCVGIVETTSWCKVVCSLITEALLVSNA